jgi:hypothetical protein
VMPLDHGQIYARSAAQFVARASDHDCRELRAFCRRAHSFSLSVTPCRFFRY